MSDRSICRTILYCLALLFLWSCGQASAEVLTYNDYEFTVFSGSWNVKTMYGKKVIELINPYIPHSGRILAKHLFLGGFSDLTEYVVTEKKPKEKRKSTKCPIKKA